MTAKEYLKSKNIKEICNLCSGKGTNGYFITPEQMEEFAQLKVKNNVSLDCVSKSLKCHAPKDYACRMAVYGCEESHCGYYK